MLGMGGLELVNEMPVFGGPLRGAVIQGGAADPDGFGHTPFKSWIDRFQGG
jgi:hypothetical protein